MVTLLKANPWIGYAIVVGVMLGIIAAIFITDCNPLRKPLKQEAVIQTGKITPEATVAPPEVTGNLDNVRDVVRHLRSAMKSLEKERVIQSIPELQELGKQFEKTVSSWGTVTTSGDK